MAKCILNGVTFDINPNKDSGWYPELVMAKQHVPGTNTSLLQISGRQSEIRRMEGVTKDGTTIANLLACVGSQVTFVDRHGVSSTVLVESVVPDEQVDITNMETGTFKYTLSLIKVA